MEIPSFERGQPNFAWKLQALSDAIRACNIIAGDGLYIAQKGPAGVVLARRGDDGGGGGSSSVTRYHPFQVYSAGVSAGVQYLRVNGASYLYKEPGVKQAINGLGFVAGDPSTGTDPGAFPIPTIGKVIWLEIELGDNLVISTASIWEDTKWTGYPNPYKFGAEDSSDPDYYKQTNLRVPIAEISTADDYRDGENYTVGEGESAEVRRVVQLLKTDLQLFVTVYQGCAVLTALPCHNIPLFTGA